MPNKLSKSTGERLGCLPRKREGMVGWRRCQRCWSGSRKVDGVQLAPTIPNCGLMDQGRGVGQAHFKFDVLAVGLNGLETQKQFGGDAPGALARAQHLKDLQF